MTNKILEISEWIMLKFIIRYQLIKRKNKSVKKFDSLKQKKQKILEATKHNYTLEFNKSKFADVISLPNDNKLEYTIGTIDQDGFIMTRFESPESPESLPIIEKDNFMVRERFDISVVVKDGILGIKKEYKENVFSFVNEVNALYIAGVKNCNVPRILDINFDTLTIIISYIEGDVLREELAKKGAKIRDSEVGRSSDYSYFDRKKNANARIIEAKKVLDKVIDDLFIEELKDEYRKINLSGVVNNDIKYGNIIIEDKTKKPYIIDFESSWSFKNTRSRSFQMLMNRDENNFKKHFY